MMEVVLTLTDSIGEKGGMVGKGCDEKRSQCRSAPGLAAPKRQNTLPRRFSLLKLRSSVRRIPNDLSATSLGFERK